MHHKNPSNASSRCKTCLLIQNPSQISGPKLSFNTKDRPRFTCITTNVLAVHYAKNLHRWKMYKTCWSLLSEHLDVKKRKKMADSYKPAVYQFNESKSVRWKVVSIESRFDQQKSIRSKTRVSSIEDCNCCLSVLNLLFIKSVLEYFLIQLTSELCRTHSWTWSSRNMTTSHLCPYLVCHCVSVSRILHRAIITRHKNFYYSLYSCKTVVFIIIYSSIELTFGFDRNDLRLRWPSIELTCYTIFCCCQRTY